MTKDNEIRPDGGYSTAFIPQPSQLLPQKRLLQLLTITLTEYRLMVRKQWPIAFIGLFGFFGFMLATFGGSAVGPSGMTRIVGSFTSLATFIVPLAALVYGYDTIVGRDANNWLSVVFVLPISRSTVVLGMYLGRVIVLSGGILIGFGVIGVLLLEKYGVAEWSGFTVFLAATVVLGAVFLSFAVLVSTLVKEKAHALGLALLLWVWFAFVHDLLSLGVIAAFSLPDIALTTLVIVNPATAYRVLVLSHLGATGTGGYAALLAATNISTSILLGSLLSWCVITLLIGGLLVRRRQV